MSRDYLGCRCCGKQSSIVVSNSRSIVKTGGLIRCKGKPFEHGCGILCRSDTIERKSIMRKKFFGIMAVLCWFVLSNHCIGADAFAALVTPQKQPTHSHCHDDSKDSKPNSSSDSHHDKCQGNGCCDPVVLSTKTAPTSISFYSLPSFPLPIALAHESIWSGHAVSSLLPGAPPSGPPVKLLGSLLTSLRLAPNAPPSSSSNC